MTTALIIQPDTRKAIVRFMAAFETNREVIFKKLPPEDAVPLGLSYRIMFEKLTRDAGAPVPTNERMFD